MFPPPLRRSAAIPTSSLAGPGADHGEGIRHERTANARKLRATVLDDGVIFTAGNAGALMRLGLMPLLCAFVGSSLAALVYPSAAVSQILYTLAGVIFAVGVHRMIIREETPGWVILRFGSREFAYAGILLLYGLAASLGHYVWQLLVSLFGSSVDTMSHGVRFKAPATPVPMILEGLFAVLILALFRIDVGTWLSRT